MVEPAKSPDPAPEASEPIDPLAETRMAPAEPMLQNAGGRPQMEAAPSSVSTADDGSLNDTCNVPAHHATLPLETPGKKPPAPVHPSDHMVAPLDETRKAPERFEEEVPVSSTAQTRLAPPSVDPSVGVSMETIAHASQVPADDALFKQTRVLPPTGRDSSERLVDSSKDPSSDVPLTLVVDSTKQPPVAPVDHDTPPFIASPSTSSVRLSPGVPQHVGDYEILGLLGRGGMGVVYKAKQKKLNRIVALKMILGGLHAGDEDLRRFRQEAEASARLQHPNIVQIHEIGEVDGKPYFSLEFVDGGSLAGKMASEPQPAFAAAQLIEILARAMHYAHQRGIVHRDLKPANILLATPAPDGSSMAPASTFGIPKVTDFGLAKRMDVDLGQTHTGAILGTPSYMAPEQAGGRIREIGPCTDIYALGAILYDLLTGRPPFKANTLADTLRQVQMMEPVSPARLQPQVPRDLGTICLKCLNKEPKKRYESSLALAEDLGRFLAGEPIRARPTSVFERAWKWSKRRPAVAALIAVSVLSFVALGAGGWWAAGSLLTANRKITKANEVAESERVRAEDNLEQALGAIDGVLTQVSVDLTEVPLMEKPRTKLLNRALALFEHLPTEDQKTAKARFQSARAMSRTGEVQNLLDQLPKAESAYKDAEATLRHLVDEEPTQSDYRVELARTLHDEGILYRRMELINKAAASFYEAVGLREGLSQENPEDPAYLKDQAQSKYWLAVCLARIKDKKEQAKAGPLYREAIDDQSKLLAMKDERKDAPDFHRDYERDKARMQNNLGIFLGNQGKSQESLKTLKSAAELQQSLIDKNADIPTLRRELGRTLHNIALQEWMTAGMRFSAEDTFNKAVDLFEALIREFPSVPAYRDELAAIYRTRGKLAEAGDEIGKADQSIRKALEIHKGLVKEYPKLPEYQLKLSEDYRSLGQLHRKSSSVSEGMLREAIKLQSDLTARYPDSCEYHGTLSQSLQNLAKWNDQNLRVKTDLMCYGSLFLPAAGQVPLMGMELTLVGTTFADSKLGAKPTAEKTLQQIRILLQQSIKEMKSALEIEPGRDEYRKYLFESLLDLAKVELRLQLHENVAKIATEIAFLDPKEVEGPLRASELFVRAMILVRVDQRLNQDARAKLEEDYAKAAIENLQRAGRLDARVITRIDLTQPYWKDVLNRPDFRAVIDELNAKAKPAID